jgi:hypothetical protein
VLAGVLVETVTFRATALEVGAVAAGAGAAMLAEVEAGSVCETPSGVVSVATRMAMG